MSVEIYLKQADMGSVQAVGPMSKVIRMVVCTMESVGKYAEDPARADRRISRIEILDAASGCSTYTRQVRVQVCGKNGENETIVDGPFLWDCAAHGIPQVQAAREMGYRCIVNFPDVKIPIPSP